MGRWKGKQEEEEGALGLPEAAALYLQGIPYPPPIPAAASVTETPSLSFGALKQPLDQLKGSMVCDQRFGGRQRGEGGVDRYS